MTIKYPNMDAYEVATLGMYLSTWDEDLTFEQALASITKGTDHTTVWEPLEHMDGADLANCIEAACDTLRTIL